MNARVLLVLCVAVAWAGCGGGSDSLAIRLVDEFKPDMVEGKVEAGGRDLPRTEWKFDGSTPRPEGKSATYGWQAGSGVSGFGVRAGNLAGRSTDDFPLIHVERTSGLEDDDLLHAVEVRMKASAGANLAFAGRESETVNVAKAVQQARRNPWRATTPIVTGDQMKTYTIRPPLPVASSEIRHLLLRPTDAKGARFEIESVRLIFRKEYLARIPPGIGWHGLSKVFRETLVARSPETIRMRVEIPARPWLDLAVGTIEDGAATFRVSVRRPGDREENSEETVFERTVTTPHRWEPARVDLSEYSSREVELGLSLTSERAGTVGFWGSPAVRDSGRMPSGLNPRAGIEAPQGVIVIMADTLRSDHLNSYGYDRVTAPVLAKLASEGTLFRDCIAQATWTKVSTSSMMTGLYPSTHGVKDFSDRLSVSATTLAEVFREAGYATVSYSSVLFTGEFTNLHQGYEQLHEQSSLPDGTKSKTAREYVDRLIPWLEDHRDVPFYVFLHVFDPHDPFRPRNPYDTLWAEAGREEQHKDEVEKLKKFIKHPFMKNRGLPTAAELAAAGLDKEEFISHLHDWYDGSIRAMDAEIGRLLVHLRTLGLDEKTLVVFTSDHGEEFLEHGWMFHGQSAYGELANVPLIMRGPGAVPAGVSVDQTVRSIDIMPTVLELSGLPLPEGIQGESLIPLLSSAQGRAVSGTGFLPSGGRDSSPGPAGAGRSAITEKASSDDPSSPPNREEESFAIVKDGWKMIHNRINPNRKPEFELFDHRRDPLNMKNVAEENPEVVQELAQEIDAWHKAAEAARHDSVAGDQQSLGAEELERLRSLGYIQ